MKQLLILALAFLAFGCVSMGNSAEELTDEAETPEASDAADEAPPGWERYAADGFSFEYPAEMPTRVVSGVFIGSSALEGRVMERMEVSSLNTLASYGANKERMLRANPGKAAADFLLEDKESDPLGMLDRAYHLGGISTYSISREAYAAEAVFLLGPQGNDVLYGYALSIYVPERSLQIRARIFAADLGGAKTLKDRFLLSFRME